MGIDHSARSWSRACNIWLRAKMAPVHVDTHNGRSVGVKPCVHLVRNSLPGAALQVTRNIRFHELSSFVILLPFGVSRKLDVLAAADG